MASFIISSPVYVLLRIAPPPSLRTSVFLNGDRVTRTDDHVQVKEHVWYAT